MIRKKITDKNNINFSAAGKVTESVKSVGNNKGFFSKFFKFKNYINKT